jgi:hypothetical protein
VELTRMTDDFKRYSAGAAALSAQFGGEYMVRGTPGRKQSLEVCSTTRTLRTDPWY